MKKVAYFRNGSRGVNYHRMVVPFRYLPFEVTEVDLIPLKSDHYDTFIFNRFPPSVYPLSAVAELKKQGMRFIYDLDDHWTRPRHNANYREGIENIYTEEIQNYIKLADCVWVATKKLADLVRQINKNVVVIPNALDMNEPMWQRQPTQRARVTYGWVGGISHGNDFDRIRGFFKEPLNATPVLCGVSLLNDYWKEIGNIVSGDNKVRYVQDVEPERYGYLYNELDIKILPSDNDDFSMCKSNLKIQEAGVHGLPVISNGGVYRELNGLGIISENPSTWNKAIKRLIESEAMREDYGMRLKGYVLDNYNLTEINKLRIETI